MDGRRGALILPENTSFPLDHTLSSVTVAHQGAPYPPSPRSTTNDTIVYHPPSARTAPMYHVQPSTTQISNQSTLQSRHELPHAKELMTTTHLSQLEVPLRPLPSSAPACHDISSADVGEIIDVAVASRKEATGHLG
ncbi:hypothetical protein BDQ17DRAFT_748986 [Cyathus striatus]|nr:hypothetical protein BDQ17DRAFT_748986 [Cyathus striatus]